MKGKRPVVEFFDPLPPSNGLVYAILAFFVCTFYVAATHNAQLAPGKWDSKMEKKD
jgi:hypothetical protein